jgi:ribonuclease PH
MGSPLVLIVAGVQLSTPHHLIATATAVTTSSRAVSATVFTAIYSVTLNTRLNKYIHSYVADAAIKAGLPTSSVEVFVKAIADSNSEGLSGINGATPAIISAGVAALKQAFADGIRAVYMIAVPFGALACVACFFWAI